MHRILVIANETVESDDLYDVIQAAADGSNGRVLVVAPALNSRLRRWVSDSDEAREAARARLSRCLVRLAQAGVEANGMIGDSDPLQATVDALHLFPADEILISTHPEHRSNWLARNLVARVAQRFDGPILHLVVDSERDLLAA